MSASAAHGRHKEEEERKKEETTGQKYNGHALLHRATIINTVYITLLTLIMAALCNRAGHIYFILWFLMAAVCNRAGHYIFALWFLSSSSYLSIFFPAPNLSGHRLDVYHTSTHGVALVRI